jgi:hydroxypyruvate reductase
MTKLTDEAREILAETLRQVDVRSVVQKHIDCGAGVLRLGSQSVPLAELDEIVIVAIGKAALPMYEATVAELRGLAIRAVVVTNEVEASRRCTGVYREARYQCDELIGSHPLPDEASLRAAEAVLEVLRSVTNRAAVLFLISGGASAMVEAPLDPSISLADTAAFYQSLIGSGLPIAQMNALRKHFSAVKGGRLAEAAAKARMQCSLLISDVPVDMPDVIGSGPSLPDSSTLADCVRLLGSLKVAESVARFFAGPLCVETPKPDSTCFARANWEVILSSQHLAEAAAKAASALGFHVEVDNACDEWEYRQAGTYLLDRGLAMARQHGRSCLISVGEVGVALAPDAGEGGRNQQLALWCAAELTRRGEVTTVLSAGSDGIDGNSQAAGAVCDEATVALARRAGLDVTEALGRFDSAPLLRTIGASVVTGPTGNNLRDLRLVLFGG